MHVTADLRREKGRVQRIHAIVVLYCFGLKWGLQDACRKQWLPRNTTICASNPLTKEWTSPEASTSHKSTCVQWHHNNQHWVHSSHIHFDGLYNHLQPSARNLVVKLPLVSWSIAPFLIFGCLIYSDKVKATPPDAALITWQRVLCLISRSCTAFSIGENLLILVQLILQRLLYSCCSKTSFIQHSFIKHISHLV